MPRLKRKTGVSKRRDIIADRKHLKPYTTVTDALTSVMNIYITEGYRDRTMNDYRKYWDEFITTAGIMSKDNICDVTVHDIRKYIAIMLKERGLSPVTVNIRLGGVRAIFTRLEAEGVINESPVKMVRKLKTDEQRVLMLSDKQIRRLFSVIDKDSFAGFRDYVAMLTMLKCGLRANEINSVETSDVDFENRVILLPGAKNKNRKTRSVPISTKVADEIAQLVTESREYFGNSITHIFVNQFGEPMREDQLRKRMDKYARLAGLKEECRASPHSLRHTFSVNYLRGGGDIRSLQAILGHSSLESTEIYLDYSDEVVSEQYNKVNLNDSLDV
ncbi:tyrosine-type recombinase/integrase [Sutcliffiella horikoshii]|uniref:tyrosine-type recombinase/integrase n=1 Tax=Sutcliffiella horikoshii TaxID=79883 RepID=UPI00384AD7EB